MPFVLCYFNYSCKNFIPRPTYGNLIRGLDRGDVSISLILKFIFFHRFFIDCFDVICSTYRHLEKHGIV